MPEYKDDKLFTAILHNDAEEITRLKVQGIGLSSPVVYSLSADKNRKTLTGKENTDLVIQIQFTFCTKMQKADEETFIETARKLRTELDMPILYFMSIFKSRIPKHIQSAALLEGVIECFDTSQINKKRLMEIFIDSDKTDLLEVCIKGGWLSQPKKRDELAEYANTKGKTECTALLLDFKSRTADPAAERLKAEKKLERSLNAAPDSVTAMKQLWSFKKREDGSVIIMGYKGLRTDVTVPEKIGKNTVTAIDDSTFCPFARRVNPEAAKVRESITSIVLPDTVRTIGRGAFWNCKSLESVNIPEGVEVIKENTFAECHGLNCIVIPNSVKVLERRTFYCCDSLRFIEIPDGVESLGDAVFAHCIELMAIVLPNSVKSIGNNIVDMGNVRGKLMGVVVPQGSYAEKYCEKNGIPFAHRLTEVIPNSSAEEYCKCHNQPYVYKEDKSK